MSRNTPDWDAAARDAEDPREPLAEAVVFAHEATLSNAAGDANTQLAAGQVGLGATPADESEQQALETTAALVTAALLQHKPAAPPSSLQLRLAAAGLQFCAERRSAPKPAAPASRQVGKPGQPKVAAAGSSPTRPEHILPPPRQRPHLVSLLGSSLVGLAAGFLVWLLVPPRIAPIAADTRSPAEQLASLLAADPGLLRLHWQHGSSPFRGEVTGEVVWSQQDQRGYLTFRGLPALDEDHRFQLWIVDGQREGAPVDGGLFAISPGSDTTVVPIDARLPIGKPAAFVVTVEGKTGAVVSKQEHVVAIAAL